jgi:hypothetical protein
VQGPLLALLLLVATDLSAADAAIVTEIPAGQSKTIRVRSLPAGAVLAVRVVTNGRLLVALISARQLKEPREGAKPLFRGVVQDKLAFRVAVPEADDYVLVLSNRGGKQTLSVEAQIRAVAAQPPPRPAPKDYSPRPEKASISPSASSI